MVLRRFGVKDPLNLRKFHHGPPSDEKDSVVVLLSDGIKVKINDSPFWQGALWNPL